MFRLPRTAIERLRRTTTGRLVEHFFQGFFDNELVAPGADMRTAVGYVLGLLFAPTFLITFYLLNTYSILIYRSAAYREEASLIDKTLFVTLTMTVLGLLTVLQAEALFPDRRDLAILTPLPLRLHSIFIAKAIALAAFLGLFFLDLNLVPTLGYPPQVLPMHAGLSQMFRPIAVHAIVMLAASGFVAFGLVTVQGVLLNLLSPRLYRRATLYVQFAAMVLLVAILLLYPYTYIQLAQHHTAAYPWLPPLWFVGLYEVLVGWGTLEMSGLAQRALAGLGIATAGAFLTYAVVYTRQLLRGLESEIDVPESPGKLRDLAVHLTNRLMVRHPVERATFYFTLATVARSRLHRLLLAAYLGAGIGFEMLNVLHGMAQFRAGQTTQLAPALLGLPLLLSFFLLTGMRMVFTIPAELSANWVFRMAHGGDPMRALAGAREAMFVIGVLPFAVLGFPAFVVLWGWRLAALQCVFFLLLSLLLLEVVAGKLRKIPFTCSYLPGQANLIVTAVLIVVAVFTYSYDIVSIENSLMRHPARMLVACAVLAAIWGGIRLRNRLRHDSAPLVFEEQLEPAVRTLGLVEP